MKKRVLLLLAVAMSALQAMALSTTDFESNNYIQAWGQLKLVTTPNSRENKVQLADKNGKAVQLRGWSTHGYQWPTARVFFDKEDDFNGMKLLGANVVRLACYVSTEENSQLTASAWNNTKTWVKNAITWCEKLGLYAIVDYHVLKPGNPSQYLLAANNNKIREKAETFFADISTFVKENGYHHVLYEICNEPNPNISWTVISNYTQVIFPIIAENDPHAVVIVGTPNWCQYLDRAERNKLTHETLQIMYTFHYYACSHYGFLNSQFTDETLESIPVFATEWNDTDNTGKGKCADIPPSTHAANFLTRCNNDDTQRVSWTAWSWSKVEKEYNENGENEDRTSSSWKNSTPSNGTGYTKENLSPTGLMIYEELQKNHINYETGNSVESTASAAFSIYPNPAKDGNFQVTLPVNETVLLSISNLQGQTVYSTVIENGSASINTELEAGVYIVSVKSENGLKTKKLVIK